MSEITELEAHISFLEEQIELASLINRLEGNEDFKKFVKAYTEEEALRCIQFSADPGVEKPIQEEMVQMAKGTVYFKKFIEYTKMRASQAQNDIEKAREQIDEIRAGAE